MVARDHDVAIRREREAKAQEPVGLGQHRRPLAGPQIARIPDAREHARRFLRILGADTDRANNFSGVSPGRASTVVAGGGGGFAGCRKSTEVAVAALLGR